MLKIPTPRKKRLQISFTHSVYYPREFKYSKALFLVTHKSTIFPTDFRRNITQMQMQSTHLTKMPQLAGKVSLGECWVCLEGKLAIRFLNPLLSIASSSGMGYFCSITAWWKIFVSRLIYLKKKNLFLQVLRGCSFELPRNKGHWI